jgi:para-nitrobenzyl esterase
LNNVPILSGTTNEEGKYPGFDLATYQPGVYLAPMWTDMSNFSPDNPSATPVAITDLVLPACLPVDKTYVNAANTGYNGYAMHCASIPTLTFWSLQASTLNRMQPLQAKTYAYNFLWNQQPAPWNSFIGAAHVTDVAFLFGNFGQGLFSYGYSTANQPGREALSLIMRNALHAFMLTGNPNNASLPATWLPWSPTIGQVKRLEFNADLTTPSAVMSANDTPTMLP